MADTGATRSRRYRQHRQGDHSLCRRNCRDSQVSLRIAGVAEDPPEIADAAATLAELAGLLMEAYRQDPSNAALAREARATLLSLPDARDAAVEDELASLAGMLRGRVAP